MTDEEVLNQQADARRQTTKAQQERLARMGAYLVEHHYSHGVPFWMVQCDLCGCVLNSGHHYLAEQAHHADRLAEAHNTERHGR